ncbi:unnamed protein product [Ranitomeya imitator]|uniref:Uncharacterized protein n=1 Tax=Ranitomeya imitator TaxID=111125 RepID=A0ABN9LAS0_9NEOB|nr:unnamed protein product [Ranitomeya imitator]
MQSYNDATYGFGYKSPIVQKSIGKKGKENEPNASAGFQPEKHNPALEKHWPQDLSKSRLPILSKVNQPPDFQKLHQSWQNQFQKGKAVKKKACTRPQPFNFSQKLDRPRVAPDTRPSVSPPARHRREPLAEVTSGQKNQSKYFDGKGGNAEFKADPAALASILSDVGVSVPATGKLSLAQRVPMRASSIAQSSNLCKNTMVRSSMYAVLRSQSASSNLDRISCFANMQPKVSDKKPPVFKQNSLLHVRDRKLEEPVSSSLDGKLLSQENPVLQQMSRTANVQSSSMNSPLLQSQEVTKIKSTPLHPVTEDVESSVLPADKHEKSTSEGNSFAGKQDPRKKAGGAAPVDFVADSQALASILSNTGVTTGNYGKLSLAQRVPVQSKNVTVKSGMISLDFVTTPKPYYGRISAMAVPIKGTQVVPLYADASACVVLTMRRKIKLLQAAFYSGRRIVKTTHADASAYSGTTCVPNLLKIEYPMRSVCLSRKSQVADSVDAGGIWGKCFYGASYGAIINLCAVLYVENIGTLYEVYFVWSILWGS